MKPSHYARDGHDNNFQLMRLLAASAVVLSHSYSITTGAPGNEALMDMFGRAIGDYAVDIFFIASGFLIAQSWTRSPDVVRFSVARLLRIFPALIVAVLATGLILGPLASMLQPEEFYADPALPAYVLGAVSTLAVDVPLPGVFETVPEAGKVNVPLWTLKYELAAYGSLLVLAGLSAVTGIRSPLLTGVAIAALYAIGRSILPWSYAEDSTLNHILRLLPCFYLGVLAYMARNHIPLNVAGLVCFGGLAWLAHGTVLREAIEAVFLAYATLWLAFVPKLARKVIGSIGDYSFGIYIFAYPLQQLLLMTFPGLGPMELFALAMLVILPLAMLSWHFIEKTALAKREQVAAYVKGQLARRTVARYPSSPCAFVHSSQW